jgi:hypothetical protein
VIVNGNCNNNIRCNTPSNVRCMEARCNSMGRCKGILGVGVIVNG